MNIELYNILDEFAAFAIDAEDREELIQAIHKYGAQLTEWHHELTETGA